MRKLLAVLFLFGSFAYAQTEEQQLNARRDSLHQARAALRLQNMNATENGNHSLTSLLPATPIGGTCHSNIMLNFSDILHHSYITYANLNGEDPVCNPPSWYSAHQYDTTYQRYIVVRTCCINMGPEDLVIDTNITFNYSVSPVCEDGMYMKDYYKFYTEDCLENQESQGYKEKLWLVSDNGLYNIVHSNFWGDTIVQDQEQLDTLLNYGPYPDLSIVFNPAGNGGTIFPPYYEEPYRMVIDRGAGDCYYNYIPFNATSGYHELSISLNLPPTVIDTLYPNEFEPVFRVDGDVLTFYQTMPNCCPYSFAPVRPTGLSVAPGSHTLTWDAIPGTTEYKIYRGMAYNPQGQGGWIFDELDGSHTPTLLTSTLSTSFLLPHTEVFYYYFVSASNCAGESLLAKYNKKVK